LPHEQGENVPEVRSESYDFCHLRQFRGFHEQIPSVYQRGFDSA
jgi:hypothetical protein